MGTVNVHRRRHRSASRYLFYSKSFRLLKPSKLEALRFSAYAFIFIWSLVALAIAVHFESIFQSSDLTRFIPYAISTAAISMVTVVFIVAMVLVHGYHSLAIKTETVALGVIGIFWLALSILMATSPAEDAEVECFFDQEDTQPTSGFSTEAYQAQYRVLVAAGCINAVLFLGFCLLMLFLSFRHYRQIKDWIEYTGQPLLGEKQDKRNPSQSTSRGAAPLTTVPQKVASKTNKPKEVVKGLPLPVTTRSLGKQTRAQTTPKRNEPGREIKNKARATIVHQRINTHPSVKPRDKLSATQHHKVSSKSSAKRTEEATLPPRASTKAPR